MNRVLVLGASGMLGHKVLQTLASCDLEVNGTVRVTKSDAGSNVKLVCSFAPLRYGIDAMDFSTVNAELQAFEPEVVVNCIGVVKQKPMADNAIVSVTVNTLFPHLLDRWCAGNGARLIHFSTDCVFSGETGGYREDDFTDARDLYGRTKYLGEVADSETALTLRTSIIGRELSSYQSLVEWFYAQEGRQVDGFTKVMYSGVTTLQLARVVSALIQSDTPIRGLYQVAGPWVSKFDLLTEIRNQAGLDIDIKEDDSVVSDRTMYGDRFAQATNISMPTWRDMIFDMVNDTMPYKGAT